MSDEPYPKNYQDPAMVSRHSPQRIRKFLGMVVSLLIFAAAAFSAILVQRNLRINPRTEDAQVRANVVGISPQVGGTIVAIHVKDNQLVKKGQLLYEIDERPYQAEAEKAQADLALTEFEIQAYKDQITAAEAALRESQANALYASNYAKRVGALVGSSYVTTDKNEQAQTQAQTTAAKVEQDLAALAQAALRDAALKLSYCRVYAPCDGYVTDLQITPGVYASVGEQIFSLVDKRIWYVLAYFRETDLRHIQQGMEADVYFMAESGKKYRGIVQGIPKAVVELGSPSSSTPGGQGILSQVSPTIDFILLAQRYPVRIVLDEKEEHSFRMGGTASVIVHTQSDMAAGSRRLNQLERVDAAAFTAPLSGSGMPTPVQGNE